MPTLWDLYPILIGVRIFFAFASPIFDCDETFNYWEPLHYLMYGSGLQPWEYSPEFALRSYAYLFMHFGMLKVLRPIALFCFVVAHLIAPGYQNMVKLDIVDDKIFLFKLLRLGIAIISATSQTYLCDQIEMRYNKIVSRVCFFFLFFSPGFSHASVSLLPNTFVMNAVTLVTALWIKTGVQGYRKAKVESIISSIKKKDNISVLTDNELLNDVARFLKHDIKVNAAEVDYAKDITGRTDYVKISLALEKSIRLCYFLGFGILSMATFFWPYAGLAFIPFGLSALSTLGIQKLILYLGLISGFVFLAFSALDSFIYGRATSSMVNQILYNVFGQDGGSELYGSELVTFYIKNLMINFNFVFVFSLLSVGILGSLYYVANKDTIWFRNQVTEIEDKLMNVIEINRNHIKETIFYLTPLYLVLGVFCVIPHKEERFLYQIYPLLCFSAALFLYFIHSNFNLKNIHGLAAMLLTPVKALNLGLVVTFLVLSLSRQAALKHFFSGPMDVLSQLNSDFASLAEGKEINSETNICFGQEWYRFPSSYFLPTYTESEYDQEDKIWSSNILWIESDFHGLLPQPFGSFPEGLKVPSGKFNDKNTEEKSAYSKINNCDFIVEFDVEGDNFAQRKEEGFDPVICKSFLNAEKSKSLFRSFYIPFGMNETHIFNDYCLLKKK
eukprot:maker-scaffold_1-snap-gene-21.55-mRNA-1 protein AED:0.00 eAED:0.00 QI:202/1/1/1/1/1/2/35/670